MRPVLTPLLLTALIGCASGRHIRTGDHAAVVQDWTAAYKSYERATHARPGSEKARQRLSDARQEVMALLDVQIAADLAARRFTAVGQLLEEAERYDPPRTWRDAHAQAALAAIRADVAGRTPPEAHEVLSACAVYRPLSALAADRDAAGAAWAAELRAASNEAGGYGAYGGAIVLLSGARQLAEDPSDPLQELWWWSRLRSKEWGGMHLTVRGPSAHRSAITEALSEQWARSPWAEAPIVSQEPSTPHLSAQLTITAAGCDEAQMGTEDRQHRYTDGTFVANPRIGELHQQIRDNTRSLREAEGALSRAQQRLEDAHRRQASAEADIAAAAPRLEDARRRDATAASTLQEARAEHDASLEARAAIQEREREVAVLLEKQRERNDARRDLERILPERQVDAGRARQARDRAEQAAAEAEKVRARLAAEIAAAEQRIAAAQATLDSAAPVQEAAEQAQADLPGHRSQLRAASMARKAARAALEEAREADEAAAASLQALLDAPDTPPEDLDTARAEQVEARASMEAARAILTDARQEAARLKEAVASLEAAVQRGTEQDTARAQADLDEARRDLDGARAEQTAAESDQARARQALAAAGARLQEAEVAVKAVEGELDAIRRVDAEQSRRLGQIESEIGALSPSLSLLSARSRTLSRAERDQQDTARQRQDAEANMAQLLDAQQAAALVTAERQEVRQLRDSDRAARIAGLHALETDLAATPAEIEVVKSHPYTVTHWRRTCTFTAEGPQARTAATTSDDATWAGFAHGGLSGDPLRYATGEDDDLTASREAVVAAIWSDLSGQLLAQGADYRRQAASTTNLESATRAWLLADWLAPEHTDPALAEGIRARYPVP